MVTIKFAPNEGWAKTPKLWKVLATHVEHMGGEATITDAGLTVKASTAKREKGGKALPTVAEEIAATLTQHYRWKVEDE